VVVVIVVVLEAISHRMSYRTRDCAV
jgi:hypothetical protein